MAAGLTHFAFLVAGRLGEHGFYRFFEVAASSLKGGKTLAAASIVEDGAAVDGFDEIENRGPAASTSPGVITATGYALHAPAES